VRFDDVIDEATRPGAAPRRPGEDGSRWSGVFYPVSLEPQAIAQFGALGLFFANRRIV